MQGMNPRQKDNLTDATENFEANNGSNGNENSNSDPHSATDNDGNPVTLGQTGQSKPPFPNKGKPIELTPELIKAITEAVKIGVADALDKWTKKVKDESEGRNR
jgi:hypothetical protein